MNDKGEMSGPKNRIQMKGAEESEAELMVVVVVVVRREGGTRDPETQRSMNKRESGIESEGDPLRQ